MTAIATVVDGIEVSKVRLTTSLYRLRKYHAGQERYDHLVAQLGPDWDDRKPINLLTILEHNGVDDTLWALCATEQNCDQIARLMAADFAEAVLPIFDRSHPADNRPREAIAATRLFAVGKCDAAAEAAARDAAWAAAEAAAWAAAWAAAEAAAWAAARDAAEAAARAAAEDAAWAAAEAAARAAARDAAWDAAEAAAWDAAEAAAWAAAWDAAWAATWDAARDAAGAEQASIIRRYLLEDAE